MLADVDYDLEKIAFWIYFVQLSGSDHPLNGSRRSPPDACHFHAKFCRIGQGELTAVEFAMDKVPQNNKVQ
jgi:hypothetical protein